MAKIPSFQFYPGDWLKDSDVRRCSIFARGLLIDLLCVMFESKTRGVLCEIDGTPWPDDEILATVSGASKEELAQGLRELERKHVLSRNEQGALYSRRIVRDEELRQIRADSGRLGGEANGKAKRKQKRKQNASTLQEDEDEEEVLIQEDKKVSAKTIPPKCEWVAAYCAERDNGIDAQEFIDHYEANGWRVGQAKNLMRDWQAAIRTWERTRKTSPRSNGGPKNPTDPRGNLAAADAYLARRKASSNGES